MKQGGVSTKGRIISWWLIVVSLLIMVFGSIPYWGITGFGGDWIGAALALFLIAIFGLITSISGIFLLKQKKWAWKASVIMLVLVIFIMGRDYIAWLGSGGITFFEVIFDYHPDFLDVFYASVILIVPLSALVLLLLNRKNLLSKYRSQELR